MGAGCDLRAVRKDGSEFPVDIALSAMETADGPLFYAAVRDITHSRLAAIVEASDDAIIGKLLDGTVTSWNAGAQKLYGYTAAEMVGTNISRLVPADLPDELPDILRRVGRGERVAHFMTRRTRKDGSSVDVSITVSPISDSRGALLGATTVARDITDRERAVQAAARLGAIVDSSDDAIIGWGRAGTAGPSGSSATTRPR
jgi:PAS domain S-box-containing protein